jgi:hypothetical protein
MRDGERLGGGGGERWWWSQGGAGGGAQRQGTPTAPGDGLGPTVEVMYGIKVRVRGGGGCWED